MPYMLIALFCLNPWNGKRLKKASDYVTLVSIHAWDLNNIHRLLYK